MRNTDEASFQQHRPRSLKLPERLCNWQKRRSPVHSQAHRRARMHPHTRIGADARQKSFFCVVTTKLCRSAERPRCVCGTAGWHTHGGGVYWGCRPESGGLPDVDKAWYRLLSAHSERTQRKESIRVTSQQNTVIFDF